MNATIAPTTRFDIQGVRNSDESRRPTSTTNHRATSSKTPATGPATSPASPCPARTPHRSSPGSNPSEYPSHRSRPQQDRSHSAPEVHQPGQRTRHENVQHRAHHQRTKNPDRHIPPRILSLLRRRRHRIESDIRKKNRRRTRRNPLMPNRPDPSFGGMNGSSSHAPVPDASEGNRYPAPERSRQRQASQSRSRYSDSPTPESR